MPRQPIEMRGQRFGRLIVVALAPSRPGINGAWWRCRCDCGQEITTRRQNLVDGRTRSCGCLHRDFTSRMMASLWEHKRQPTPIAPTPHRTTPLRGRLDIDLLLALLALLDREPLQTQAGIAAQLDVSRPTISRTLAQAEATLGVVVVVTQQRGPGMPRWSITDWGVLDRGRALARGCALLDVDSEARLRAYRQA